jgi:hypothetical protein
LNLSFLVDGENKLHLAGAVKIYSHSFFCSFCLPELFLVLGTCGVRRQDKQAGSVKREAKLSLNFKSAKSTHVYQAWVAEDA